MSDPTSQSIGVIRCETQLQENLFLGRIEFPEGQARACVLHFWPDDGDDLGRRRFVKEAMLGLDVSRDHENLLSTLHLGVWEDGRLFMAVDLHEGPAASQLRPRSEAQATSVGLMARGVLQALEYLHRRGVAHGAIIGSNILMGLDGVVRLGDFSKARPLTDTFDGQSDLRALGRLLYELLTGLSVASLRGMTLPERLPRDTPAALIPLIEYLLDDSMDVTAEEALAVLDDGRQPVPRERITLDERRPPALSEDSEEDVDDEDLELLAARLSGIQKLLALLPAEEGEEAEAAREAADDVEEHGTVGEGDAVGRCEGPDQQGGDTKELHEQYGHRIRRYRWLLAAVVTIATALVASTVLMTMHAQEQVREVTAIDAQYALRVLEQVTSVSDQQVEQARNGAAAELTPAQRIIFSPDGYDWRANIELRRFIGTDDKAALIISDPAQMREGVTVTLGKDVPTLILRWED